jgi:hypothetical protein
MEPKMAFDMEAIKAKAAAGTLAVSTATGGGASKAPPSGVYVCELAKAAIEKSQKLQDQLVVVLRVKSVVSLSEELPEDTTQESLVGREFKWYFLNAPTDKPDWVERLSGDIVALAGQVGLDSSKVFVDPTDGEGAKNLMDLYSNFSVMALKPIQRGTLGTVTIERQRQNGDKTRFNNAIKLEVKAAKKTSALTEGL